MFDYDMMKRKKTKQYCLLIIGILILAGMLHLVNIFLRQTGEYVVVHIDNKEVMRFLLSEDTTYEICSEDGINMLEIKDGFAKVIQADCDNQVCVQSKAISHQNESIVCLPHQVTIWVESNKEAEYDAITN